MRLFLIALFISTGLRANDFSEEAKKDEKEINADLAPWESRYHEAQHRLDQLYNIENPSFKLYKDNKDSLTFGQSFAYRRQSSHPFSIFSQVDNRLFHQRYFNQQEADDAVPPRTQEFTLGSELHWESQRRGKTEVLFRSDQTFAEAKFIDSSQGQFRGHYSSYTLSPANHLSLSEDTRLNLSEFYTYRRNRSKRFESGNLVLNENSHEVGFSPSLDWKRPWGEWTFTTGASWAWVNTFQAQVDPFNTQSLAVRARINGEVFQSTYEVGAHRMARYYRGRFNQYNYQPFAHVLFENIFTKNLNLDLNYQLLLRSRSNQEGVQINSEQVSFVPGWTYQPWKKKYSQLLPLSLSLPQALNLHIGKNDFYSSSFELSGGLKIIKSIVLKPSLSLSFERYYNTGRNEYGFHAGVKI